MVSLAGYSLARSYLHRHQHSLTKTIQLASMDVHILSALADNYMYVIVDKESSEAAVVDPVDSAKVLDFISQSTPSLNLTTILTTHHHWDHSGGNRKMLAAKPNLEVLGGEKRVEGVSRIVAHGDRLCLGQLQIECLFTPCHTKGHICYKVSTGDDIALFTGKTKTSAKKTFRCSEIRLFHR